MTIIDAEDSNAISGAGDTSVSAEANFNGRVVSDFVSTISMRPVVASADAWLVAPGMDPDFTINAGHAGAWFNPLTSGQGQFIDIPPASQFMFLSWFTYTDADADQPGQQQWYTAQGKYSGTTASLDLFETLGGKFDDPQAVNTVKVGEVSLTFINCDEGLMTYNMESRGLRGEFPLQRVIPGSDEVCEGLTGSSPQAVDINAGMDGGWFEPATSGQGYFFDAHPNNDGGGFLFLSWFTYGDDTASGQRWLTAQGDYAAGSMAEIDVFETTGGLFDDPQAVNTVKVGTLSLDFEDCNNAALSYTLDDDGLQGDAEITRVVPGSDALCNDLAAQVELEPLFGNSVSIE
jgi:hypothetical protein